MRFELFTLHALLMQCGVHLQMTVAFTRGWHPYSALTLANAVGAATATSHGAGQNVAAKCTVEALLRDGARSDRGRFGSACGDVLRLMGW